MDTLKDFLSEIKSRLSSPLFSSFAIAWIIFNWRIWIPLFFYSQPDLKLDNYRSFADLIEKQTKFMFNLGWPALIAVFYTFVFPYIKVFISEFHTKINTKSMNNIVKITGESVMPMSKYITMKADYDKKEKELEEVGHERGELIQSNKDLISRLNETEKLLADKDSKINDINSRLKILSDYSVGVPLLGQWKVEFLNSIDTWTISPKDIYVNSDQLYQITRIYGNLDDHSFVLVLKKQTDLNRSTIITIHRISSGGLAKYSGSDAHGNKIVMSQQQF